MYRIRFRTPSGIPFYPLRYLSHLLILISLVISIIGFILPLFVDIFGLHRVRLTPSTLPFIFGQILFYQFLHGGWLHLFFNGYFLYSAGPEIESRMKRKEFFLFFFGNSIFVAICLWFFSSANTIGISGFCMALLSYLYMDLKKIGHPLAQQILIMLIINIALGFTGNISLVGHASGAIWGLLWWYIRKGR